MTQDENRQNMPLEFVKKAVALLKVMQRTPNHQAAQDMAEKLFHLLEDVLPLLEKHEPIDPRNETIQVLVESTRKGILDLLRYFPVHESNEYKEFRAVNDKINEFFSDPRVDEFMATALRCAELLETMKIPQINMQVIALKDALNKERGKLKYHAEQAYGETFATLVQETTGTFTQFALQFAAFRESEEYGALCGVATHAAFFVAGAPPLTQEEQDAMEGDSGMGHSTMREWEGRGE